MKSAPATQEMQAPFRGQEDPLEEETVTHSRILPRKSRGQRSLVGDSPRGRRESDVTGRLNSNDISLAATIYPFQPGEALKWGLI